MKKLLLALSIISLVQPILPMQLTQSKNKRKKMEQRLNKKLINAIAYGDDLDHIQSLIRDGASTHVALKYVFTSDNILAGETLLRADKTILRRLIRDQKSLRTIFKNEHRPGCYQMNNNEDDSRVYFCSPYCKEFKSFSSAIAHRQSITALLIHHQDKINDSLMTTLLCLRRMKNEGNLCAHILYTQRNTLFFPYQPLYNAIPKLRAAIDTIFCTTANDIKFCYKSLWDQPMHQDDRLCIIS